MASSAAGIEQGAALGLSLGFKEPGQTLSSLFSPLLREVPGATRQQWEVTGCHAIRAPVLCDQPPALFSWGVQHRVRCRLGCGCTQNIPCPSGLTGTTWSAWSRLCRRYRWMNGSAQSVLPLAQPKPLVSTATPLLGWTPLAGYGRVWCCAHVCGSPGAVPDSTSTQQPGLALFPDASVVSEEEVSMLLADVVPTTSRLRPRTGRTRAIARTRQSERVRATVNRNRISTASRVQVGRSGIAQQSLGQPPG